MKTYEFRLVQPMAVDEMNRLGADGFYARHIYSTDIVLMCRVNEDKPKGKKKTSAVDVFARLGGV